MRTPKEVHRYVLGVSTGQGHGGTCAWLIYCVDYDDGTTRTEKGPTLSETDAERLGILGDLRHATMANARLESHMSDRDEKIRSRRKRR